MHVGRAYSRSMKVGSMLGPSIRTRSTGGCDARDEREGVQNEADNDGDEQRGGLGQLRRGQGGLRAGRGEEQGEEEVFRREGEQAARQLTSDGRWVEVGEANARSFDRGYEGTEPVRTR